MDTLYTQQVIKHHTPPDCSARENYVSLLLNILFGKLHNFHLSGSFTHAPSLSSSLYIKGAQQVHTSQHQRTDMESKYQLLISLLLVLGASQATEQEPDVPDVYQKPKFCGKSDCPIYQLVKQYDVSGKGFFFSSF